MKKKLGLTRWLKNMKIIDANIILRYLLDDHQEYFKKAKIIIENNNVLLLNEVIAEVVYVLEKVYKISRSDIKNGLFAFFSNESVFLEKEEIVHKALALFSIKRLDFVDCLLYAYSLETEYVVFTFDKKLKKTIENRLN